MGGSRGKKEGSACAGQSGAGAAQVDGWASRVHQQDSEVPKLPRGERAARAVRISGELSALLALLIWANEECEWQGARTRRRIIRSSASGACRGGDTTREAQRAGLDGHWVASWEGSEGSREEGERERVAAGCRDVDRCAGWSAPGLRTSENTSGDVRANLGGHPAPRPPGDRRLHGWCRKTLNGEKWGFYLKTFMG